MPPASMVLHKINASLISKLHGLKSQEGNRNLDLYLSIYIWYVYAHIVDFAVKKSAIPYSDNYILYNFGLKHVLHFVICTRRNGTGLTY